MIPLSTGATASLQSTARVITLPAARSHCQGLFNNSAIIINKFFIFFPFWVVD
jgi:hypothetical protein